jgi:hypothetical protein
MKEFYIQDCNGYILGFGSKAWIYTANFTYYSNN